MNSTANCSSIPDDLNAFNRTGEGEEVIDVPLGSPRRQAGNFYGISTVIDVLLDLFPADLPRPRFNILD